MNDHHGTPTLAVTIGDVAGIGPEITAKSLLGHAELRSECRPVVIGDAGVMRSAVAALGGEPDVVREIEDPRSATNEPGTHRGDPGRRPHARGRGG